MATIGAVSTVMNAEADLRDGVEVVDASGAVRGTSVVAAQQAVSRAVLLHGVLVPACALLVPVATRWTPHHPMATDAAFGSALWDHSERLVRDATGHSWWWW